MWSHRACDLMIMHCCVYENLTSLESYFPRIRERLTINCPDLAHARGTKVPCVHKLNRSHAENSAAPHHTIHRDPSILLSVVTNSEAVDSAEPRASCVSKCSTFGLSSGGDTFEQASSARSSSPLMVRGVDASVVLVATALWPAG